MKPSSPENLIPIGHLPHDVQEFLTTVVTLLSDQPIPKGVEKIFYAVAAKEMTIAEANKKINPIWEKRCRRLYAEHLKSLKVNGEPEMQP